jgi:hypothetical protein
MPGWGDMGNDKKYRRRTFYSTGGTVGSPGLPFGPGRGGDGVVLVVGTESGGAPGVVDKDTMRGERL